MIDVGLSSTMRCHQRNVSPLTTPPGFPPSVPRPIFCDGSLMSLIIRKSRFPTLTNTSPTFLRLERADVRDPRQKIQCARPWDRPTCATTTPVVRQGRCGRDCPINRRSVHDDVAEVRRIAAQALSPHRPLGVPWVTRHRLGPMQYPMRSPVCLRIAATLWPSYRARALYRSLRASRRKPIR